ncbi:hypothetical protein IMZ48_33065 [Candidatus Bathyarchaeota archaeon]|nr:hypothetical protein [Candidatus Bathyarchaeota archaeon]
MSGIDETTRALPGTIEQGFKGFREHADQYFSDMALKFDKRMNDAERRRGEEDLRLQTGVYHMLEEHLYRLSPPTPYLLCATSYGSQSSVSPMGSPGLAVRSSLMGVGLEQIFATVGIHLSSATGQLGPSISHIADDLDIVLRHTYETEESELARVHYLMREPRFLSWLNADANRVQSDMLLINGYFDNGPISPLSVFSGFLVSGVIAQSPASLVLHHFCTLHKDPRNDALAGPRGLLRRLIAQTLTHLVRLDVHSVLLDWELLHDAGAEGDHDLNALCELFGRLLEEVPEGLAVFIIIDNVSDFETSLHGWGEEMDFVVGRLSSIGGRSAPGDRPVLAPSLRASVRVLLTCGMKSVGVFRWVGPRRIISLEAENE